MIPIHPPYIAYVTLVVVGSFCLIHQLAQKLVVLKILQNLYTFRRLITYNTQSDWKKFLAFLEGISYF
jgi:hypothetical protein